MKAHFLRYGRSAVAPLKSILPALSLLLIGCVTSSDLQPGQSVHQTQIPAQVLPDYLSSPCANIWHYSDPQTIANPLYWLRTIACSQRLSPAEARAEAQLWPASVWQNAFKRGILLSPAKITPPERRRYMTQLDMLAADIPPQVRDLFMVWRDGERAQLELAEERSRYIKLQQTAESERNALMQSQQALSHELEITHRKLESLSDIERQLSSRKPSNTYTSDVHQGETGGNSGQRPQETRSE